MNTQDNLARRSVTPPRTSTPFTTACARSVTPAPGRRDAGSRQADLPNILVATDSPESLRATLSHARLFVEQFGSKVMIVYIAEPADFLADPDALKTQATKLAGLNPWHIGAVLVLPKATSVRQIAEAARDEAADLMVISQNFHMGRSYFLRDNSLEEILRHAPCPVLVVSKPCLLQPGQS